MSSSLYTLCKTPRILTLRNDIYSNSLYSYRPLPPWLLTRDWCLAVTKWYKLQVKFTLEKHAMRQYSSAYNTDKPSFHFISITKNKNTEREIWWRFQSLCSSYDQQRSSGLSKPCGAVCISHKHIQMNRITLQMVAFLSCQFHIPYDLNDSQCTKDSIPTLVKS